MSIKEDVEKVQHKIEVIENQSFAFELLKDQRKQNKRLFIIILVILTMWFATIGYLVYILNDIDYVDEATQEIYDVNSIENSDIVNGDYYGDN